MNRLYGLIGFPLGHSFSARYFTEKFQRENLSGYEYRNFPLESIRELPAMLENHPGLLGFNVTIPYKQEVIPFLTALSAEAREIGAVNCVKITPQGLYGHNTDAYGFRKSLLGLIGPMRPDALILGTGGASKAVGYVLRELGIAYTTVSRSSGPGRLCYRELTAEVMLGNLERPSPAVILLLRFRKRSNRIGSNRERHKNPSDTGFNKLPTQNKQAVQDGAKP